MADQDRDEPSLELPSFSLRQRRKSRKDRKAEARAAKAEARKAKAEARAAAESEPVPRPEPAPQAAVEPEMAAEPEVPAEPQPDPTPTTVIDADQPTPDHTEPIPVAREGSTEQPAASAETAGRPLFADEAPATATAVAATEAPAEPEPEVGKRKPRRSYRVGVGAIPGAIVTGILVGAATVGLTWGSLRLCEEIRGASSCGGTGLFVLLLILLAMIFLGAGLLRLFRVADAGSTSFLAVGLLTVVVLLFLVDVLFNWWMIIVIPCVTLLTYTLSSWVTTSFVDSGRD